MPISVRFYSRLPQRCHSYRNSWSCDIDWIKKKKPLIIIIVGSVFWTGFPEVHDTTVSACTILFEQARTTTDVYICKPDVLSPPSRSLSIYNFEKKKKKWNIVAHNLLCRWAVHDESGLKLTIINTKHVRKQMYSLLIYFWIISSTYT